MVEVIEAFADRERGRFRGFLRTSVRNYVSRERRRAAAVKRGGGLPHLSLDFEEVVTWNQRNIQVLLHVARRLSAILSDGIPPVMLPLVDLLRSFVAFGVQAAGAEWGNMERVGVANV